MKQTILAILFSFKVLTSFGQNWQNVGSGVSDNINDLIKFDNKLYACGSIGVVFWDNSTWTSLPNLYGLALSTMAIFNDTLYIGSAPYQGTISHVFKYNGTGWVQVGGDFSAPFWSSTGILLNYNGQLISGGHFTSIDGTTINNIASWNGTSWNSMDNGLNGSIWYLTEHNGQLIATGDFTSSATDTTVYRIAKWDGISWHPIDVTHRFYSADPSIGNPVISFNGDLIIGNVWDTIAGIQMKGITKWNGNNFSSMGNNLLKRINNFWIFNNELYLCGKIYNLNPYSYDDIVLKWNGFFWQQVGQIFNQTVWTIDDFNGEVYCGGNFTACGTASISYIAKNSMSNGLTQILNNPDFKIYPNPTPANIVLETTEKGTLTISNQLGQLIRSCIINDTFTIIETSDIKAGIYFLNFHSNNSITASKLIKE